MLNMKMATTVKMMCRDFPMTLVVRQGLQNEESPLSTMQMKTKMAMKMTRLPLP